VNILLTIFDESNRSPLLTIHKTQNDVKIYDLYLPGLGQKITQVRETLRSIIDDLDDQTMVNDVLGHIRSFNLPYGKTYFELMDVPIRINLQSGTNHSKRIDRNKLIKILLTVMLNHNNDVPSKWQQLLGEASFAYRYMENREIWNDLDRVSVYYDFNTSTGRSRSRGFNLQGTNDNWHVHTGRREDRFVCFDWIAADLCMAAHMSKDQIMLTSFKTDDPYNFICRYLDDKEYNRDECKKVLLKTIYSLDFENPILELFPTFRNWMVDRMNDLNRDGCASSLLGRKYDIRFGEENVEKAKRRVINAQFQGSVAHAMQAALLAIYKKYPDNLFAEKHDSIIMTMTKGNEKKLINDVSEIMLYPLSGWLDDSFRMPHRIHVGDEWEKWKLIKIKR